jgi:hypothetical protein
MLFTPFIALTWIFKTCHSLPHGIKASLCRGLAIWAALLAYCTVPLAEEEYFDVQASNASDGTPNIVLGPRPVESVMECRQSR